MKFAGVIGAFLLAASYHLSTVAAAAVNGTNPYDDALVYVDTNWTTRVDSSIALDSSIAAGATEAKKYGTAIWISEVAAISQIETVLRAARYQASRQPIVAQFVIYNLPGRDCSAKSSAGEFPQGSIDRYKEEFIKPILRAFRKKGSNIRLSLIIEPDSLPNVATNIGTGNCNNVTKEEYAEGIAYAIAQFSTLSNTWQYIDSAHGGWLGWNQAAMVPLFQDVLTRAQKINKNAWFRGFSSSVSNYNPFFGLGTCPASDGCPPLATHPSTGELMYNWNTCIDENITTTKFNALFEPAGLPTRWIIDTSRSGNRGFRKYWSSWCNPKGAGIGPRPQANPAPQVDAFVWVKPPGESDGVSDSTQPRYDTTCDPALNADAQGGAPQAGNWFHENFVTLVKNADPPLA